MGNWFSSDPPHKVKPQSQTVFRNQREIDELERYFASLRIQEQQIRRYELQSSQRSSNSITSSQQHILAHRVNPKPPAIPVSRNQREIDELDRYFALLRIQEQNLGRREIQSPQRSQENSLLIQQLLQGESRIWSYELECYDSEYQMVYNKITRKDIFKVDSIEKLMNPFLNAAYKLRLLQKEAEYKEDFEGKLFFHGTKNAIVSEICRKNFNWRMCKAHEYGYGVSFSPNSTYASNYSDKNVHNKVMLVVKVMVGGICEGDSTMVLPSIGCDTSEKPGGVVIVKYDDNEFCPVYKINYHVKNEDFGKKYNKKQRFVYVDF